MKAQVKFTERIDRNGRIVRATAKPATKPVKEENKGLEFLLMVLGSILFIAIPFVVSSLLLDYGIINDIFTLKIVIALIVSAQIGIIMMLPGRNQN